MNTTSKNIIFKIKDFFYKAITSVASLFSNRFYQIVVCILLSIILFTIPALSNRFPFNYILIVLVSFYSCFVFLWCFKFCPIKMDYFAFSLLIFNIIVFLSSLLNNAAELTFTYFSLSIFAFFTYQFFKNKKNFLFFKISFSAALIAFSLTFAFLYIRETGFSEFFNVWSSKRLGGIFDNENNIAYFLLYGACFFFALIDFKKAITYLWFLPLFFILFLIFKTGSRSAILIFLFAIFIWLFYVYRKRVKYLLVSYLIIIGLIFITVLIISKVGNSNLFDRFISFFNVFSDANKADESSLNRITLAFESFYLFLRKPILGWGNNAFQVFSTERAFAHNNISGLLCEFGLFGFLSFEILIILPIIKIFAHKYHLEYKIVLIELLSIFFVQFFYVNAQLKIDNFLIGVCCASLNWSKVMIPFKQKKNYDSYVKLYI